MKLLSVDTSGCLLIGYVHISHHLHGLVHISNMQSLYSVTETIHKSTIQKHPGCKKAWKHQIMLVYSVSVTKSVISDSYNHMQANSKY